MSKKKDWRRYSMAEKLVQIIPFHAIVMRKLISKKENSHRSQTFKSYEYALCRLSYTVIFCLCLIHFCLLLCLSCLLSVFVFAFVLLRLCSAASVFFCPCVLLQKNKGQKNTGIEEHRDRRTQRQQNTEAVTQRQIQRQK